MPGRADGQGERQPEVVEAGVAGLAGQGAAGDVLQAGLVQAVGDVAIGGAGHGILAGHAGLNLPGGGPEDPQHGHPATGDVPQFVS